LNERPTRARTIVPESSIGFYQVCVFLQLRQEIGDRRRLLLGPPERDRYGCVELTPELVEVLWHAAALMSDGTAVSVSPVSARLTTTQAAEMLGVSRPTLVRLLDEGRLQHERVGSRRYVLAADLAAYQRGQRRHGRR
jgi:excisionase family DNA binding protein